MSTQANAASSATPEPSVTLVDDTGLRPLQERPPLHHYLAQLWGRRHFILAHSRSSAFSSGRDTFLGRVWLIFDPLLQVAVYALIFGVVLKVSRGMDNFLGFLIIGVIFFHMLSAGLTSGSGLIQSSRAMISSFSFPKAVIPFSVNLKNAFDNLIPAVLAVGLALLFQLDKPVSWTLVLVPVFYVLIYIFTTGLTMITARLTAVIPDTTALIRVVTQGLFFVSGVFFSLDRFADSSILQEIMKLNPYYQFLTAIRLCVLDGEVPPLSLWGSLIGWSLGVFIVGLVYFWRAEGRYARIK